MLEHYLCRSQACLLSPGQSLSHTSAHISWHQMTFQNGPMTFPKWLGKVWWVRGNDSGGGICGQCRQNLTTYLHSSLVEHLMHLPKKSGTLDLGSSPPLVWLLHSGCSLRECLLTNLWHIPTVQRGDLVPLCHHQPR